MKRDVPRSFSSDWGQEPCHRTFDGAPSGFGQKGLVAPSCWELGPNSVRGIGLNAALYPIADAILKIGRYIATTINPITIPRNTIIIGSSSDVSEAPPDQLHLRKSRQFSPT